MVTGKGDYLPWLVCQLDQANHFTPNDLSKHLILKAESEECLCLQATLYTIPVN